MGRHEGRRDPGPGDWLRRIGRTFAAGLSVVRQHPELWALPVISVGASGVLAAAASASFHLGRHATTTSQDGLLALAAVVAIVMTLGNAALVSVADQVLRGGAPSPFTFAPAVRHRVALLRGLVSQTGGSVGVAVFATLALTDGTARWWTLATVAASGLVLGSSSVVRVHYLLVPVIIIEGLNYADAKERMTEFVKQTWQGADGATGLVMAGMALYLPVLAIVLALVRIGSGKIDLTAPADRTALLIVLGWGALVWVLTSAVQAVYRVALYRFAAEGVALAPFAAADLELAFGRPH